MLTSFDRLVGAAEQWEWHFNSERICTLEVQEQFNFSCPTVPEGRQADIVGFLCHLPPNGPPCYLDVRGEHWFEFHPAVNTCYEGFCEAGFSATPYQMERSRYSFSPGRSWYKGLTATAIAKAISAHATGKQLFTAINRLRPHGSIREPFRTGWFSLFFETKSAPRSKDGSEQTLYSVTFMHT